MEKAAMKILYVVCIMMVLNGCMLHKNQHAYFAQANPIPLESGKEILKENVQHIHAGQLQELPIFKKADEQKKPMGKVLDEGNEKARVRPSPSRFFNSITYYDYTEGSLYQIFSAPFKVTTILLEPGEIIQGSVFAGDTRIWKAHVHSTGKGKNMRQMVLIKPMHPHAKTNMIIPTDRRVYHLELTSFENSFMAQVAWHYPEGDFGIAEYTQEEKMDDNLPMSPQHFYFKYTIKRKRGKPSWKPDLVFDDGTKTYIRFPKKISSGELPALFLKTNESQRQLVNYRYKKPYIIVDRLFEVAELRIGNKKPEVVRISRK